MCTGTSPDVLYPHGRRPADQRDDQPPQEPDFFPDLNLDQVVDAITADKAEYHLKALYWSPLLELDTIGYRHEVFADLERAEVGALIRAFAEWRVTAQFGYRTKELREDDHGVAHHHRTRFYLNAVEQYGQAVLELADGLRAAACGSRGLNAVATYLSGYVGSAAFQTLHAETERLQGALSEVQYVVVLRGDRITVAGFDDERDYSERVAATFARFQPPTDTPHANSRYWESYAGTGILDLVAQLHPEVFSALDRFCDEHLDYLDPVIARFERDVQFYLAYLDHIAPLRAAGLPFSYPVLSSTDKSERALDTFDLALAHKLHQPDNPTATPIVGNDVTLAGPERILVISGPNNGGKTTMARTVGQLHHLARLGCPVPGRDTQLLLCDQIFTHFERAEDATTMTGKLQTELNGLHDNLAAATPASVIILNEIFSSTTAADALYLGRQILERVSALGALCVCVTFLDELATLNDHTVSMVSTVAPHDPVTRTHKVIRQPADGRAYARAIADKYGLGFDRLVQELSR